MGHDSLKYYQRATGETGYSTFSDIPSRLIDLLNEQKHIDGLVLERRLSGTYPSI